MLCNSSEKYQALHFLSFFQSNIFRKIPLQAIDLEKYHFQATDLEKYCYVYLEHLNRIQLVSKQVTMSIASIQVGHYQYLLEDYCYPREMTIFRKMALFVCAAKNEKKKKKLKGQYSLKKINFRSELYKSSQENIRLNLQFFKKYTYLKINEKYSF